MIHELPVWMMALLVSGAFVGLSVAALRPLNRFWPVLARHAHNEIAGFIIAVVGVLYAVLLASVAVLALENLRNAEEAVRREADLIGDLYRDAAFLPVDTAALLRAELRAYGKSLVDQEWPAMRTGVQPDTGWQGLERLQARLLEVEPRTKLQESAATRYLANLDALYDARRDRLLLGFRGLEPVVWGVLLSGAAVTLLFSMFFGVEDLKAHMAMTGLLAFSIALVMVLILAVDQPLRGASQITSAPVSYVLAQFDRLDRALQVGGSQ